MKKNKLVLVGAGEFAQIAYEYFTYDSEFDVVAYSVNENYIDTDTLNGIPVVKLETLEETHPSCDYQVFVAIPASELNQVRKKIYENLKNRGYSFASYISSSAFVWKNAIIGENTFIFENNTVQPFVKIGNNVVLWSGNHIGHRTTVEDHVFISSHVVVSGYCNIGEGCFIGVNSTFNDHTSIASYSILASTSLVNKNLIESGKIYFGNPAKIMPKKSAYSVKL
ncbi:acetyltransferase [Vibrio breoganii]|uniref:acetyltransferase n=1 Tax=Vibrio breoganii TaxID=553239 RepID=UPI000C83E27F|nr:acetyltransferase [Vibrio breoganii]PML92249.1 sugar O-acyltransferase [Vibrio breoganii]PMN70188.1 sugar O-acyltransferase [Vibrio breoganii]